MGENLALFSRFYYRPSRAAGDALDNGSVVFAIALAVGVLILWTFAPEAPRSILRNLTAPTSRTRLQVPIW